MGFRSVGASTASISPSTARRLGDRHGESRALNNLGLALRDAGRSDEAITAHQDATAIFRQTGDRHGEGIALGNLERTRAAQQA